MEHVTCENCAMLFRLSGIDSRLVSQVDFEFFHVLFCGAEDDEWDELEKLGFYFEI